MRDLETTRQLGRQELLPLLEASSDVGNQRVTAEMPLPAFEAAMPPDTAMPFGTPDLVVRFHTGSVPSVRSQRSMVIAVSCLVSLVIGIALAALLM